MFCDPFSLSDVEADLWAKSMVLLNWFGYCYIGCAEDFYCTQREVTRRGIDIY